MMKAIIYSSALLALCAFTIAQSDIEGKNGVLAEIRLNYSEPCNSTDPTIGVCDPSKHLKCRVAVSGDNERCWCEKADDPQDQTLIYDDDRNTCVSLVGGACREIFPDGYRKLCTKFASCNQPLPNQDGTCECSHGSMKTPLNTCKLTHGYGQCSNLAGSNDCHEGVFLKCGINATCICDLEDLAVWDGSTCKSLFRGLCTGDTSADRQCVAPFQCIGGNCGCNSTTHIEYNGQCVLDYDKDCTTTPDQCHPDFPCNNDPENPALKKCLCKDTENREGDKCNLRVDQPCDSTSEKACTQHSTCSPANSTCLCDDGYEADSNSKLCKGKLGTPCSGDSCSAELHLACPDVPDSTCGCKADYAPDGDLCVGNIFAPCSKDSDCMTANCPAGNPQICTCPEGYPKSDNTTCVVPYDFDCSGKWECDADKYLVCPTPVIDGTKCQCDVSLVYQNQACLGKPGAECSTARGCSEGAECRANECACFSDHYVDTEDGLCKLNPGGGGGSGAVAASLFSVFLSFICASFLKN